MVDCLSRGENTRDAQAKSASGPDFRAACDLSAADSRTSIDALRRTSAQTTDAVLSQFGHLQLEPSATSASDASSKRLAPDIGLIQEDYNQPHLPFPFISKYESHEGTTLYYVASAHSSNPSSQTFKLIDEAIKKHSIDAVVVESAEGPITSDDLKRGGYDNETAFAAKLATDRNIPVVGGDVGLKQGYEYLRDKGYSTEDYLNLRFSKEPSVWGKDGIINKETLKTSYDHYVNNLMNGLNHFSNVNDGRQLSFDNFLKWYQEKAGKAFDPQVAKDRHDSEPSLDGTPLQRMSAVLNQVRNQVMVETIAKELNQHRRVLVIFGGSHFVQQQQVMEKMLGEPRYQSNQLED